MTSSAAMEDGRNPGQREASSNGSLEQFNLSQPDEWEDYAQRFEFFLEGAGHYGRWKEKVDVSQPLAGPRTFQLAKALVAPDQLKDTPYEDIIAALRNHLSPKPPELARRYEFHRREQATGHIAKVCRSQRKRDRRANFETNGRTDNSRTTPRASTSYCDNLTETAIHDVSQPGTKKIHVAVEIEGVECEMEVDSGSTFSLISEATARQIFPNGAHPEGPPVKLALNPEVVPVRLKASRVPFVLRQKIDAELDKLLQQGVLEPVDCAEWETPIVTPLKGNGDIRICADYKCTINKALQQHAYPVPVVSHVLASLSGGTIFAKLDLAQAYQQLPVTDESAAAQTIVTHRGAFRVRRLQFGVSVAPGIFQNLMETLLRGIPGVIPYFDDVLIAGASGQELLSRLREVLRCFQDAGLKVKREKCQLGVAQVEFLGFRIDAEGIHPTPEKTQAILGAPRPSNKTELQAFLGLVNFYHAFLPHKATVAEPLHPDFWTRRPPLCGAKHNKERLEAGKNSWHPIKS
ncbi:hypothetical protein MRX96_039731 [Rhipicephalus microplus]